MDFLQWPDWEFRQALTLPQDLLRMAADSTTATGLMDNPRASSGTLAAQQALLTSFSCSAERSSSFWHLFANQGICQAPAYLALVNPRH